jgi:hypothetical protein
MNTDQELEWAWDELKNIPMNNNEELDEDFTVHFSNIAHGDVTFKRGTDIYEIWHYFDEMYSKGVASSMGLA